MKNITLSCTCDQTYVAQTREGKLLGRAYQRMKEHDHCWAAVTYPHPKKVTFLRDYGTQSQALLALVKALLG